MLVLPITTRSFAQAPRRPSIAALVQTLEQGPSDEQAEEALLALGSTRSDTALDALRQGMRHRVATVRVAALQGFSNFRARPDIAAHVALGLRDHDPLVRGQATRTLVAMDAREQVEALMLAFERGVAEAAIAIGALGQDHHLPTFTSFLGKKPIAEMLAGYQAWLTRRDVSEATKIQIVATLEEMAGLTVKRFMQELLSGEALTEPGVRRAVSNTITRIPETPSTRGSAK